MIHVSTVIQCAGRYNMGHKSPRCAWNPEAAGDCYDLKSCPSINLPKSCLMERGCVYSQVQGVCLQLSVAQRKHSICVSSGNCTVADTFCNMDYGKKGYCQNCVPITNVGRAQCDNTKVVVASGAAECKAACFQS